MAAPRSRPRAEASPGSLCCLLAASGQVVVEFAATLGTVLIEPGDMIEVTELGPYCDDPNRGNGADRYDVYLCSTTGGADAATLDFDAACTIELGQ